MAERFLLVLWLTDRCNLSCKYCYAQAHNHGKNMDVETAKRAIAALRGHPLKIQFAGGEPLLNLPLALEICRFTRHEGIDAVFQLQTNATLLTEQTVSQLRAHRIRVGVSLDGIPPVNSLTRGATDQAVRGIRLLGNPPVGINAVVTDETVEALPKLVDFAFYLGNVGGIGLDLLRHAGRGTQCREAEPEALRRAFTAMYRRSRELQALFGRTVKLREIELAKKRLAGLGDPRHYCYASCGRSLVVLPEGRCYPCGSLVSPEFCLGTVDAPRLRPLPRIDRPDCGTCPYVSVCPGGCPSRAIRNRDDLECILLKTAFTLAEQELRERNQGGTQECC